MATATGFSSTASGREASRANGPPSTSGRERSRRAAQLRQWYGHAPDRFEEFARRYRAELGAQRERLSELRRRSRTGVVTLVFATRDAEHSNATVLADVLRRGLR